MDEKKIVLDGAWTLAFVLGEEYEKRTDEATTSDSVKGYEQVAAKVPGNFELDFERAGLIEDPFFGKNILKLQELETLHLFYYRKFYVEETENMRLRLEGVDTFASVYLNGVAVGETDNMMIAHEFQATGLKKGENEIFIHIRPTYTEARKYPLPASAYALSSNFEALYLRKPMHAFGWDIMPRAVSGGIWKSVFLYAPKKDRIDDVFGYTLALKNGKAHLAFHYNLTISRPRIREYRVVVKGVCGESEFYAEQQLWHTGGKLALCLDDPKLWWPKNYGEPNLYKVTASLYYKDELVDVFAWNMGVRTIKLDRTSLTDGKGNGEFRFLVNGVPVFLMGTNWVPVDAFHSRDRERLPEILPMLNDLNCNVVRSWGGNLYEDDLFFDFCDENGILVWQDFSLACAEYPNDEIFLEKMRKEAKFVVKRLRNHPSLALWAGDNECDYIYALTGLAPQDPNTNAITRRVFPEVLHEEDFTRPYLPSSPCVDEQAYRELDFKNIDFNLPPQKYISEDHLWGPRDYFKSPYYLGASAHFASEMGYHGCNGVRSIEKFISKENLWHWKDNEEWLVHSVTIDGKQGSDYSYRIQLMETQIETLFNFAPENLETFALASQISQAEAKKYFVERFRVKKWKRTGIIWWNLIDGWPQFSDAVVDYYYAKKLAYYYIKRSQQSVCVMFDEPNERGECEVVAVNDLREDKKLSYKITEVWSKQTVAEGEVLARSDVNETIVKIPVGKERKFYLIEWTVDGKRYCNHYVSNLLGVDFKEYVSAAIACGFELDAAK